MLKAAVIGCGRIGFVLDMPNKALKRLGDILAGIVIRSSDLDRRPVLPLIVDDLLDELRELVDLQVGAAIGLTL